MVWQTSLSQHDVHSVIYWDIKYRNLQGLGMEHNIEPATVYKL